jgi:chemotaxis protein methyltransferase CheR
MGEAAAGVLGGVKAAEFREVQALARDVFGLDLKQGKEGLVGARLSKRVRELGLGSIGEYLARVRSDRSGAELVSLIDALTTNFTSFLREPRHFELLRARILPELEDLDRIRIWSAGCSSGEEPYSVLFSAAEHLGAHRIGRLRLLATDISTRALGRAEAGIYPEQRLLELPEPWRQKYFQAGFGASAGSVRVRGEWRQRIEFSRLNLMERFDRLGRFHVIFCRNVMIYFDKPTQEDLVRRFAAQLEPGGWPLIGHSEGLMGIRHDLRYVMPAVYRRGGVGKG